MVGESQEPTFSAFPKNQPNMSNKGFVVARRNCGLGDVLGNVSLCWYIAKKTNCDLIIDWQRTIYHNQIFGDSLFPLVFEKANIDGVQIFDPLDFGKAYQQSVKPKYQNKYSGMMLKNFNFNNTPFDNQSYFTHRFLSQLQIKPCIQKDINDFYQKNLLNKYIISVHFRFGDNNVYLSRSQGARLNPSGKNTKRQIVENAVKLYSKNINEIKKFHKDAIVLVFTDCKLFWDILSNEHKCIDTVNEYPEDGQAFHKSNFKSPYEKIREAVYLMWLMKSCSDFLLYNHSNFNNIPRLFLKHHLKLF